jgi:CheY-like chemotaxis protein
VTDSTADGSPSELADLVRDALLHLYDVTYLQTHPLATLASSTLVRGSALQGKRLTTLLLDAIEALRPSAGSHDDARSSRSFHLLELRYVDSLSVSDILKRLSISKTQYQREHARALLAVVSVLRERHGLSGTLLPELGRSTQIEESREALALNEADALASQLIPDYLSLGDVLTRAVALVQPMAVEHEVALTLRVEPGLPRIFADRSALQQAMFGVLSTAIQQGAGGEVGVDVRRASEALLEVALVTPLNVDPSFSTSGDWLSPELGVARRLVAAIGGTLAVDADQAACQWRASMRLRAVSQSRILVVDNHPEFIELIRRYLAEHDWLVSGAQYVRQAHALALQSPPDVVLLDVMMPGEDGWDLLLLLKSQPETKPIPIVICSVLYEPDIAHALGAAGYLPKPVNQVTLLSAIEPWRRHAPAPGPSG